MIKFSDGSRVFNFRVAGVAMHKDHVLLHQGEGESFWTLPGGRVEMGEQAADALEREMREELNADVVAGRLLWTCENFFSIENQPYHEISLYFLMRFQKSSQHLNLDGKWTSTDAETRLTFRWFACDHDELSALPALPEFLQSELASLPAHPKHIVQVD